MGGETVHTSSSRRAGRLIPARAGRYLVLGCFFGVVPAHPRAGGALLRAHRALPGAASRIGVGQSALGQVISLPQCAVSYPNAQLPAPMRVRVLLPQCAVSCPNAGPRLPRSVQGWLRHSTYLCHAKQNGRGPGARDVLQAMPCSQREVWLVGGGLQEFSPGIPTFLWRWAGAGVVCK